MNGCSHLSCEVRELQQIYIVSIKCSLPIELDPYSPLGIKKALITTNEANTYRLIGKELVLAPAY